MEVCGAYRLDCLSPCLVLQFLGTRNLIGRNQKKSKLPKRRNFKNRTALLAPECRACGTSSRLELDHWDNDPLNARTLCFACNATKAEFARDQPWVGTYHRSAGVASSAGVAPPIANAAQSEGALAGASPSTSASAASKPSIIATAPPDAPARDARRTHHWSGRSSPDWPARPDRTPPAPAA